MKTIGLIGGMSWESSHEYYRLINQAVNERLGGLHSAQCILYSLDFHEIEGYQVRGEWELASKRLIHAASSLEKTGADFVMICTNTMHLVADIVQEAISIPLIHIAEATANHIKAEGLSKLGLLGTKYTMEKDFYKSKLEQNGLEIITPDFKDRNLINTVIYDELCLGKFREGSRQEFKRIISSLQNQGAQGIILGCTEIGLLVTNNDCEIPLFDTTKIHALEAVKLALGE
ncbi:aspartate/glutamate racemase family protein [Bacillus timonensis]|nr:aspartate/glutamate racemase family protein [Bacillus timonensis]